MSQSTFVNVENEYKRTNELKQQDVQLLQEWVAHQSHLPPVSELQLMLFLHSSYYNIESAKKKIDLYYTIRSLCPEFFKNRNPAINTKILKTALYVPLSTRTPEGYQIFYCKFIDFNPNELVFEEMVKSIDIGALLMLFQTGIVDGHIVLVDLKGMTPALVDRLDAKRMYLKKFFYYFQGAFPIRLKNMVFFNISPPCMDHYSSLVTRYLRKEVLENTKVYGEDYEDLYKLIPKRCFPADYGGEAESIKELISKRNENLLAHKQFLVEGEMEIADELKRVGKPVKAEDIFGEDD